MTTSYLLYTKNPKKATWPIRGNIIYTNTSIYYTQLSIYATTEGVKPNQNSIAPIRINVIQAMNSMNRTDLIVSQKVTMTNKEYYLESSLTFLSTRSMTVKAAPTLVKHNPRPSEM